MPFIKSFINQRVLIKQFLVALVLTVLIGLPGINASAQNRVSKPVTKINRPVSFADFETAVKWNAQGRQREAFELLVKIYRIKLSSRQNRQVRFLMGSIAHKLQEHKKVRAVFSKGLTVLDGLSGYVLFLKAKSLFDQNKFKAARVQFDSYINKFSNQPLAHEAGFLRAECFRKIGRITLAIKQYRRLLSKDKDGRVHLALADSYLKQGRKSLAQDTYKKAAYGRRAPGVRAQAYQKYKRLLIAGFEKEKNQEINLKMVQLLLREWKLDETITLIERLMKDGGEQVYIDELAGIKARMLMFRDDIKEATRFLEQAHKNASKKYKGILLSRLASGYARLGNLEKSAETFTAAGKASIIRSRKESAYFQAGQLYLRTGQKDKGLKSWNRIRSSRRNGSLADEILWHSAWFHVVGKSWGLALERFSTLSRRYPRRYLGVAGRYWTGRTLEKLGRKDEITAIYLTLLSGKSGNYYRILSLERLRNMRLKGGALKTKSGSDLAVPETLKNKTGFWIDLSKQNNSPVSESAPLKKLLNQTANLKNLSQVKTGSMELNLSITRLKSLIAAGVFPYAIKEALYLERLIEKVRKRNRGKEIRQVQSILYSFMNAYYFNQQDYSRQVKLKGKYNSLLMPEDEAEKFEYMRGFYPLAYIDIVNSEAQKYGLDSGLILSVIRAESFYDPNITSIVNAGGLMQILPSTGRKIADRLGESDFSADDTFIARTNIRYGAWYLASLVMEFDGQIPLALAAYNAGPHAVKRWLKQTKAEDLEEFIEFIPYAQTRNYVKKILIFYYRYKLFYEGVQTDLNLRKPLSKNHTDLVDF